MNASQLIERLSDHIRAHGDLPVRFTNSENAIVEVEGLLVIEDDESDPGGAFEFQLTDQATVKGGA